MYEKAKQHLLEILSKSDGNTVAIMGDSLYYEINGEVKTDIMRGWDNYFHDIVLDKDFVTESENMHLFITLN